MAEAADCDATEAGFNERPVSAVRYSSQCPLTRTREAKGTLVTPPLRVGVTPSCLETRGRSRPGLSGAMNTVFETRQLLRANRAAGVEFAGGDADFGAEAEFTAIGELG